MVVCHLPYGPTAYFGLSDVKIRHEMTKKDMGHMKEQAPHLIFENFNSNLGILKSLALAPLEKFVLFIFSIFIYCQHCYTRHTKVCKLKKKKLLLFFFI
jgi:rRNA maturation protein Rpf1